jgi:hypothetical protein
LCHKVVEPRGEVAGHRQAAGVDHERWFVAGEFGDRQPMHHCFESEDSTGRFAYDIGAAAYHTEQRVEVFDLPRDRVGAMSPLWPRPRRS